MYCQLLLINTRISTSVDIREKRVFTEEGRYKIDSAHHFCESLLVEQLQREKDNGA